MLSSHLEPIPQLQPLPSIAPQGEGWSNTITSKALLLCIAHKAYARDHCLRCCGPLLGEQDEVGAVTTGTITSCHLCSMVARLSGTPPTTYQPNLMITQNTHNIPVTQHTASSGDLTSTSHIVWAALMTKCGQCQTTCLLNMLNMPGIPQCVWKKAEG